MSSNEKQWVRLLAERLNEPLQRFSNGAVSMCVGSHKRLLYACEVAAYENLSPVETNSSGYETDLLLYDKAGGSRWVPRVVVECKLGGVTTHDALTYSAKAFTHKHVHPYLRYGILVGDFGESTVQGRLSGTGPISTSC